MLQNGVIQTALLGFKYMGRDLGGSGGVIVNTSSVASICGFSFSPVYNATKAAVNMLTKTLGVNIQDVLILQRAFTVFLRALLKKIDI